MHLSMLYITHDLATVGYVCDKIAIMYLGRIVELGPTDRVIDDPLHPYTQLLIESIPSIKERKPLKVTEGLTHDLRNPPPGCIFQFRCPEVMDVCREVRPPMHEIRPRHEIACHLFDQSNTANINEISMEQGS